jgi:hypothetical protein
VTTHKNDVLRISLPDTCTIKKYYARCIKETNRGMWFFLLVRQA